MNIVLAVVLAVIVVAALVALGVWLGFWWSSRRRRTTRLREQFGPEYSRAVDQYGSAGRAEEALTARTARVVRLHIKSLSPDESRRYATEWRKVQSRFVDDPQGSIGEADRLVHDVMQARGYPMGEFEQRAADVSVDHPRVVEHYRAAHAVAGRASRDGTETEEMRQAMVHYRALFDELIETREPVRQEVHS
jgi:hypothetical protein